MSRCEPGEFGPVLCPIGFTVGRVALAFGFMLALKALYLPLHCGHCFPVNRQWHRLKHWQGES